MLINDFISIFYLISMFVALLPMLFYELSNVFRKVAVGLVWAGETGAEILMYPWSQSFIGIDVVWVRCVENSKLSAKILWQIRPE